MRMSHIYQPVMLIELLQQGGSASVNQIARSLLGRDQSQIEYYEDITKTMVGRVLTKNRGLTEKKGDNYHLTGFSELSKAEVDVVSAIGFIMFVLLGLVGGAATGETFGLGGVIGGIFGTFIGLLLGTLIFAMLFLFLSINNSLEDIRNKT